MKHIRQLDFEGCGIACAAMLAGKTYQEARDAWVGTSRHRRDRLNTEGRGLKRDEINALLIRLGYPWGTQQHVRLVQSPAGPHWILVFESAIYDPAATYGPQMPALG